MLPSTKKKTYNVQKEQRKNDKKEKEKEKEKKEEKKTKKTQVRSNKVKHQLNPHCSKCPHKPPQSLTPKDQKKLQSGKNYSKLYKIT